ncbi:MAG: nuclear transport factor 2 family protein [Novosphingobium sp.]|uniref:ester cyclase n=1 Tax=Novosphingobium sp. TaxID=1874826 RepID=UPI0026033537|nr:ester cyclase [Novosphingobium sp.]MCP5386593.1 nuclear transport factor 2 family protein [Novosphingobium sp.]
MDDLAERRMQVVRDHMRLECELDFEAVLETFAHPRYEINGDAMVFDGRDEVMRYFESSRTPFPDQGNELISIAHAGDNVHIEMYLTGTHLGPLKVGDQVVPPTGKSFKVRMAGVFQFAPGSDKIVCERPYVDPAQIARQLGLG